MLYCLEIAQKPPSLSEIQTALTAATDAVVHAKATRRRFGRRRTRTRASALTEARDRCAEGAVPLRSYLGMVAWHPPLAEFELAMKHEMEKLRYERRQIDKMKL